MFGLITGSLRVFFGLCDLCDATEPEERDAAMRLIGRGTRDAAIGMALSTLTLGVGDLAYVLAVNDGVSR